MGVSEEAAKQRVFRALGKLREMLGQRGVAAPAAALGAAMAGNAVGATPAGLVEKCAAGAVAGPGVGAIVKGTVKVMAYANAKVAGGVGIALCLLIGVGVVGWRVMDRRAGVVVAQVPTPAPVKPQAAVDWRAKFDAVYRLDAGEVVRRVAPPFIEERERFFDEIDPRRARVVSRAGYSFTWEGQALGAMAGPMQTQTLRSVVTYVLNVPAHSVELPETAWAMQLSGDWVVRRGASEQERLAALAAILKRDWGAGLRFERREVERAVIVARGRYEAKAGAVVDLFADRKTERAGEVEGDVAGLLKALGELAGAPVVVEGAKGTEVAASWRYHDVRPGVAVGADRVGPLVERVARQTGLELKWERRKVWVWVGAE
jgi:hypothetical protein